MKARVRKTKQIVYVRKGVFEYLAENGEFYKEYELEFID